LSGPDGGFFRARLIDRGRVDYLPRKAAFTVLRDPTVMTDA
jgi:hypothetical protein